MGSRAKRLRGVWAKRLRGGAYGLMGMGEWAKGLKG
jgi:hypothetical protein